MRETFTYFLGFVAILVRRTHQVFELPNMIRLIRNTFIRQMINSVENIPLEKLPHPI